MKNTIFSAALLSSVFFVGLSAQASSDDCPDGSVCLFDDMNYQGNNPVIFQWDLPNIGGALNDRVTSIWNRTQWPYCVYENTNYGGRHQRIAPGESIPVLDSLSHVLLFARGFDRVGNDTISSAKTCE